MRQPGRGEGAQDRPAEDCLRTSVTHGPPPQSPGSSSPMCSPWHAGLLRVPSDGGQVQSHAQQTALRPPHSQWLCLQSTAQVYPPEGGNVTGMPAPCPLSTHTHGDGGGDMRSLALPSAAQDLAHSPAQWAGLPTARPLRAQQSGQNTKTHPETPKHLPAPPCVLIAQGDPTCRPSDLGPLASTCPTCPGTRRPQASAAWS